MKDKEDKPQKQNLRWFQYKSPSTSTDLSEDAIVTFGARAAGADLSGEQVRGLYGDVCRKVTAGTGRSFLWRAGDFRADDAPVEPVVTAWTESAPPLYCAVDLTAGTNTTSYPFQYYPSAAAIPGGVGNLAWKTQWLLMRRIDPTGPEGFTMGTPDGEALAGRNETPHTVILTQAYYMAIYETTQEQWVRVCQTWTTDKRNNNDKGTPMASGGGTPFVYRSRPADSMTQIEAAAFAADLAARTGRAFRLPTEAQWEWACQAGAGDTVANYDWVVHWDVTGMLQFTGNHHVHPQYDLDEPGPREVGSFPPNAFGLYDMEGNAWELARDHYVEDRRTLANQIDPEGPSSTSEAKVVIRGGSYYQDFNGFNAMTGKGRESVTPASRYPYGVTQGDRSVSVRFSIDVDGSPASTSAESAPCAVDARVKTVALSEGLKIDTLHAMGSLFILR